MQLKPITAIIVLSLVIAALSVTGCTVHLTPTVENQQNQAGYVSTDYPTSERLQLVNACVNNEKAWAESRTVHRTVDVVWYNDTKATITEKYMSGEDSVTSSLTYIHFPTVDAANAYFDSQSSIYEYRPATISSSPIDYHELTGHNQTVYKQRQDMDSPGIATITQYDALIVESYFNMQSPANQA